jgi:transposase
MKRFKPPVVGNKHEHLPDSMPCERASKRRFRKRVRAFGMRRARYLGLTKTHLQHLGIAAAINLVRAVAWLDGDELAPTRLSAYQRLCLAA